MLKNNSRIDAIQKEMDRIQQEGAKQEGSYYKTNHKAELHALNEVFAAL